MLQDYNDYTSAASPASFFFPQGILQHSINSQPKWF